MSLSQVEHQSRALEALNGALAAQQVHHAWLFVGPEGVGKELTAIALTQALCCPEKPFVGCGTCSSCKRIEKNSHPDVTWLMPEDEQVKRGLAGRSDFDHVPSRDIRIEQIRKLQERLSFRPVESKFRVALLFTAHAMNPPAQNALLKTLEEPGRDTVLILISSAPDKLLPTIRSRCAKAQFGPLPVDFIAEKLMSQAKGKTKPDKALAQQAAAMSGGSLSRALSLDLEALAVRREVIEQFEKLVPHDARGWVQLAESLGEDRATAEVALDVLQVWFRDVAVAQSGGSSFINVDLAELASKAAARVSHAGLQRRSVLVDEARNAITARNGALRLQLERMFIEMFSA